MALYVDRHGVLRHTPGSGLPGTPTQFSRAMDELGMQIIFALPPQANGRVERTAGTFQDQLVTELRLAGAGGIGEANDVLDQFLLIPPISICVNEGVYFLAMLHEFAKEDVGQAIKYNEYE